ncbi:hypothetical protein B808_655 [Fructilactobacillus florum 8D]|uniref:Uncharacterized protein n=2 Tax=Fructilactobacillus florum TaxID=640331 RepID=W9EEE7_9LACO|nr:hypothetical protein [Fructilactobacillus florum]ETO40437.1 hypothetical protein B808_655 [Fructilactobacillus florum 8D]KRM91337.1 hypothetical protein FC87_GL001058 [Fructilactobacillus florum DSM 22689 = JCM 16035]
MGTSAVLAKLIIMVSVAIITASGALAWSIWHENQLFSLRSGLLFGLDLILLGILIVLL